MSRVVRIELISRVKEPSEDLPFPAKVNHYVQNEQYNGFNVDIQFSSDETKLYALVISRSKMEEVNRPIG